jgi:hypothetical protein
MRTREGASFSNNNRKIDCKVVAREILTQGWQRQNYITERVTLLSRLLYEYYMIEMM